MALNVKKTHTEREMIETTDTEMRYLKWNRTKTKTNKLSADETLFYFYFLPAKLKNKTQKWQKKHTH